MICAQVTFDVKILEIVLENCQFYLF